MAIWKSRILLAAVAASVAFCVACGASPALTPQAQAQDYTQRFYEGDLAALHALFTPEFARQIPFPEFTEMRRSIQEQLGAEVQLISESLTTKTPYHRYLRRARYERFAGEIEVSWVLREDNLQIAGLVFSPVETGAETP